MADFTQDKASTTQNQPGPNRENKLDPKLCDLRAPNQKCPDLQEIAKDEKTKPQVSPDLQEASRRLYEQTSKPKFKEIP